MSSSSHWYGLLSRSCYGSHETQFTASLDLIPLQNWLYESYCCSTEREMRQHILFTPALQNSHQGPLKSITSQYILEFSFNIIYMYTYVLELIWMIFISPLAQLFHSVIQTHFFTLPLFFIHFHFFHPDPIFYLVHFFTQPTMSVSNCICQLSKKTFLDLFWEYLEAR